MVLLKLKFSPKHTIKSFNFSLLQYWIRKSSIKCRYNSWKSQIKLGLPNCVKWMKPRNGSSLAQAKINSHYLLDSNFEHSPSALWITRAGINRSLLKVWCIKLYQKKILGKCYFSLSLQPLTEQQKEIKDENS